MKKIITLTLVAAMLLAFVSCGNAEKAPEETTDKIEQNENTNDTTEETKSEGTVGDTLLADFKANATKDLQSIADVVLANFIRGNMFTIEEKERNYNYYEPKCNHGSSLSTAIHSIMASELGKQDEAYRLG